MHDEAHLALRRMVEIMAPGSGDVVAMVEAYFDESESDDTSTFLSVSGYIFEKERCLSLDADWKRILDKYELPFFRMSACAHNAPPFDKLSPGQCDDAARLCIKTIKENMAYGCSASVRQKDYAEWMPKKNTVGTAYVWCCWMSLAGVRKWAENTGFDGRVAYFFEAGHKHQRQANGVMNRIFKDERFRSQYRYGSHAFVPKETNRPVQAADILAWHHVQDYKRYISGRPRRKDLDELLRDQMDRYRIVHGRKEIFGELAEFAKFTYGLES